MFRTNEQINEVSKRTGVSAQIVRELGIMMSRVKLAREDLVGNKFSNIGMTSAKSNLNKALNYFEKDFLKCKLW